MVQLNSILNSILEWKKTIATTILWYFGLVYFRDEFALGELYLLLSGFWVIYLIGFSPRKPGEVSAYSHFNENYERIPGTLDPVRAGKELTGQILFDNAQNAADDDLISYEEPNYDNGRVLGGNSTGRMIVDDEDDADLQRALLLSLRTERETRRRKN